MLKDLGDKVPSADKLAVENGISELKSAIEANDTQRINTASEALQQSSYKLSQLLYEQASQAQGGEQPGGQAYEPQAEEAKKDEEEEVIDAEFKAE
jgi:molecular chaperone DnaK